MGGANIEDKELTNLSIQIAEKKSDGDRALKIPDSKVPYYIDIIKKKLESGFWNEVVGDKIIFIFKFKDGSVREYELTTGKEQEIDKLCAEFNNEPPEKTANVYKYISDNKFYHDFMTERYGDLINR